jgi:hypothetical protein
MTIDAGLKPEGAPERSPAAANHEPRLPRNRQISLAFGASKSNGRDLIAGAQAPAR